MTLRAPRVVPAVVALLLGCGRNEPAPSPEASGPAVQGATGSHFGARPAGGSPGAAAGPSGSAPASPFSGAASGAAGPLVLARGLRILHAPSGSDAAKVVRETRDREKADGRDLVVYVGAKWCEPCQRFHKAAQAGELDGEFPALSILEFDLDEDRERLDSTGYLSEYIPLFAVPASDGRSSSKRFSGSVKGDGAVANIAPRLRALLAK